MSTKLALMLALVAAVAVGCGREKSYKTKDGEVTVDQKGGQVTYETKGKDGNMKVTANEKGVALPDDFPKDVPLFKGAVVKMSATQGKTTVVQVHQPASAADAVKFYQEELKKQGWSIESTMNLGEGSMLLSKKEKRQCSVVVTQDGKESTAQVSVTQEGQ